MSLEVVNDSILNSPEGEEYAGPDMSASAANVPRDSGIGPLPPSASTSGGEYKLPSDLLKPPSSREEEDEEDDEIVATLPIYLHHTLAPSLTQFQYPLQHRNLRVPTWAEERGKKITARVKEQSGRVDVEVPIDADPKVRGQHGGAKGEVGEVHEAREDTDETSWERSERLLIESGRVACRSWSVEG